MAEYDFASFFKTIYFGLFYSAGIKVLKGEEESDYCLYFVDVVSSAIYSIYSALTWMISDIS